MSEIPELNWNDDDKKGLEKFPSIPLIYPIAIKSYEYPLQRMDTKDSTIGKFSAWATTVTIGIITIAAVEMDVPINHGLFYLGLIFFACTVALGATAIWKGDRTVLSPETLLNKFSNSNKLRFQIDLIHHAGKAFEDNRTVIKTKNKLLGWMGIAFAAEALCLVFWIILCHP